jgi:hypothetical protein
MSTDLVSLILVQQGYINELEKQLNIKNNSNNHIDYTYSANRGFDYYISIIDALLSICSNHNIQLLKCDVCGCPEQYLVDYGTPIMNCCRACYPPIFDTNEFQVIHYEQLYTDKSKYIGSFKSIEDARHAILPKSGYRCIFHHRKMIEQTFIHKI